MALRSRANIVTEDSAANCVSIDVADKCSRVAGMRACQLTCLDELLGVLESYGYHGLWEGAALRGCSLTRSIVVKDRHQLQYDHSLDVNITAPCYSCGGPGPVLTGVATLAYGEVMGQKGARWP